MTPAEQRLLTRAALVLVLSGLVRWAVEARRPPPVMPAGVEDAGPRLLEEARARAAEEERRSEPLSDGERLDPNEAPEVELDRLPGVGPATADAIVRARGEEPFRGADDLLRVRGIGPATLERMRPHLAFGPVRVVPSGARAAPTSRPDAGPARPARLVPVTRAPGRGDLPARGDPAPPVVDLNRATEAELTALPGIGPALAARIVAERRRRGRFTEVDELLEVRGIGPATLERLRALVRAG